MYTDVYLLMRYLLLICAKAPFSRVIFSGFFSLYVYGGLACRHRAFRLYLFAATALLRRCFSASAPKTALVLFKRQKGYRFYRCPKNLLYIHVRISPYRRNWLWWEIQKLLLLFFIKIYRVFIVLFPIIPSLRRYAVCKPIVFLIPFFHKKEIRYTDI